MSAVLHDYKAEQRCVESAMILVNADKKHMFDIFLDSLYIKRPECDEYLPGPASAIRAYRSALSLIPKKERIDIVRRNNVLVRLAYCLWNAQREIEGRAYMEEAIAGFASLNPPQMHDLVECWRMLADHYVQTGLYKDAEPYYEKC